MNSSRMCGSFSGQAAWLVCLCLCLAPASAHGDCVSAGQCAKINANATADLNPIGGGDCSSVTNGCQKANAILVPYNHTLAEWNAFVAHRPACVTINECATCGASNGVAVTAAPTDGLCSVGSTGSAVAGSGPWTWTCSDASGKSVNCSAPMAGCPAMTATWAAPGPATCSASLSFGRPGTNVKLTDNAHAGSETATCQANGAWSFSGASCCKSVSTPNCSGYNASEAGGGSCYGTYFVNRTDSPSGPGCGGNYPNVTNPFTAGYSCPAGTVVTQILGCGSTGHESCNAYFFVCGVP